MQNEPIEMMLKVTGIFLEWYRLGGEVSDHQWRDVLVVLKVRAGELDLAYLRKWASELQVGDLLERSRRDAN